MIKTSSGHFNLIPSFHKMYLRSKVRRCLSLTLKVYLSIDQRKSRGLFRVHVAASFTQWQEWIPFLFTHTHSLTYFSFYRSHTLCSRLQSSVSYWPSVSLPIQLSVCACVPQCEGVTDPDGDGFIITRRSLLFLLLFYCCFIANWETTNTKRGCKGYAEGEA